jgi:hypothetical protein
MPFISSLQQYFTFQAKRRPYHALPIIQNGLSFDCIFDAMADFVLWDTSYPRTIFAINGKIGGGSKPPPYSRSADLILEVSN